MAPQVAVASEVVADFSDQVKMWDVRACGVGRPVGGGDLLGSDVGDVAAFGSISRQSMQKLR